MIELEGKRRNFLGVEKAPNGTAELTATALAKLWMIQDGAAAYFLGYDAT